MIFLTMCNLILYEYDILLARESFRFMYVLI